MSTITITKCDGCGVHPLNDSLAFSLWAGSTIDAASGRTEHMYALPDLCNKCAGTLVRTLLNDVSLERQQKLSERYLTARVV